MGVRHVFSLFMISRPGPMNGLFKDVQTFFYVEHQCSDFSMINVIIVLCSQDFFYFMIAEEKKALNYLS